MQVAEWSENIETYDLSSEYSIRKADPEEWGIYCSVYYNMRLLVFLEKNVSVLTEIMRIGSTRENRKWVGYGWHPIIYIIYFSFHRSINHLRY